jgi:hypothetical protein
MDRTWKSIAPLGSVELTRLLVNFGKAETDGGQWHAWLTPTSCDSRPKPHTISVAAGKSETILGNGEGTPPRMARVCPGVNH